jgi:hypothetical protein
MGKRGKFMPEGCAAAANFSTLNRIRIEKMKSAEPCQHHGGSGGARTRHKANKNRGKTTAPSQIASQAVAELLEVASAWAHLTEPLKVAVLAIVRTARANGVSHE